jgi:predicted transcriptional regulator
VSTPPASDPLSKRRLKMWIRLLGVTRAGEADLREFLRVEHDTTLPRFDVMAALFRAREPLTMSELSRMLLVSNGNVTGVVDRLEDDGLVRRIPSARPPHRACGADRGGPRTSFEHLAAEHEREVNALYANLSEQDIDTLTEILKRITGGKDMTECAAT